MSVDPERLDGAVKRHRELMMLRWICEQFAARFDHLEVLIGRSKSAVSRLVTNLREAGYLEARAIMVGEGKWVFPTAAGMRACGLTYRPTSPTGLALAHIAAINDVRLHIQLRSEETHWISERQLAAEGQGRRGNLPDGIAIHEGRRVAIEVELSEKTSRRVKAKLDELEPRYDAVLYFCAPVPYRRMKALAETGRWPNLGVRELPELGAGGRS